MASTGHSKAQGREQHRWRTLEEIALFKGMNLYSQNWAAILTDPQCQLLSKRSSLELEEKYMYVY